MDVHQASISIAVSDAAGKVLMECIIETKAATVLEFIQGLRGSLWVTFEEGTSAAWLYDLLKPHVAKVVVCDPRKNALLKAGNKNDRVDARKLSDLFRAGLVTPVYHGESGVRTLRELSRSYLQRRHFGEDAFCAMMSGAGVLTKSALGTENVRDGLPLSPFRTIPRTDPRPLNRAVWPISPSKRAFFVNQKVGESFEVG